MKTKTIPAPTIDPTDYPARVRRLRHATGLTLADLGHLFGVTHACVSYWERGLRAMSGSARLHLDRLESEYGIDA